MDKPMNSKWSGLITLGIFLALTVTGFVAGITLVLLLWLILQAAGIETDFWTMTQALAAAAAGAAILGAGFIAYRELAEISSSRHMDVADRLFEDLNSPENIAARRWVYQNLPADPVEGAQSLTPEGQAAIKKVLNSLDHVAFLTQSAWIPDDIIMPWMHPMVAKSWEKLAPYILYERKRRNEPYYYIHVSKLADRCQRWRLKNLEDVNIRWLNDAL
jgi:hypothetical protein